METIHAFVSNSYFPYAMFGLFVLTLVISLIKLSSRSNDAKTGLMEGIDILKESMDLKNPEHSFTQSFQTIDQKIQKTQLKHYWSEFTETLIPPYEEIDSPEFKLYQNTKRPQEYFKAEEVFSAVRPWISSNTFVGVGLLLTFIGLIIALTFTGKLFDGGNNDELIIGLQMLLATAGVKFVASVSGLGASLVQEMRFASVRHKNHELLDKFNELLEQSLVYANAESLTARQLAHSMKQTKELEILADGIAVKIGDTVSAAIHTIPMALSDELNKTFEPVVSSIAETASRMGENNQDALSEMAKQFTDQISGVSTQAMDQVVTQLNTLVGSLEQASSNLNNGSSHINTSLESAFSELQSIMGSVSSQLNDAANQASSSFKENSNFLSSQFENFLSDAQQQNQATQDIIQQLSSSVASSADDISNAMSESFKITLENMSEQMAVMNQQVGDSLSTHSGRLTQTLDQSMQQITENVSNSMADSQQTIMNNFNSMNAEMKDSAAKLQVSVDNWAEKAQESSTSFKNVNTSLESINHRLQESGSALVTSKEAISLSTDQLLQVSQRSSSILESINNAITSSSELHEKLIASSSEAMTANKDVLERNGEAISDLRNIWQSSAGRLEGLDAEMERAFNRLVEGLTSNLDKLSQFSNKLDSNTSQSINQLGGLVDELTDAIEEVSSRLRR
ncbi:hypothetical protein [Thiomicrorhabdus sp. Milos-T2]|uniref:hypothetical protein n=1 Tax=Thiomicrorhabdus sp. Milos-T2 TaxID=90814 RepID=UPI00056E206E|nr:hypothetical protein [Thiomicrorhabdus sp. Milos-T2]